MQREPLADLAAFVAVARERSFTRAAAKLGITQSSLSHTIRRLESRLGLRLLARTTRSEKPAGSIRITTAEHAAETILMPALERLLPEYPDVKVEITVDYGLTDVVAERYDAGVRLGEQVAKDMVAVRIGPDMRMAAVAAPSYFAERRPPRVPQDLATHRCINLRLPTSGGLYAWEFEKGGHEVKVRVDRQLAFNGLPMSLRAARAGLGIAFVPEDMVRADIETGRLVRVLADWCASFSGYHLYYPSRRQPTPALVLLVEALRYRGSRPKGSGRLVS